ncbi:hypothetical protein CDD83_9776 [Cordyceps sp. RAO-2017]|nr:hypothetical protein CDD83_9776 [Cordyceps sp. RAO-2017]
MTTLQRSQAIVIVGAGIIGLDVALVLAERGLGSCTTVIAHFMPGDTAPEYTSPWAGCNFSGISGSDDKALRWDQLGYAHLGKLATETGDSAFVARTPSIEYWDVDAPYAKIKASSAYLEDFRMLPTEQLPSGVECGISCTTLTVNAPRHLLYLQQRLQDQHGVHFVRRRLDNIDAAFTSPSTRVVFNCTGNAARTLPGVEDLKCYPTRGQVVLAKAPSATHNMMRHGRDYETDCATYAYETESILARTMALSPQLRHSSFEVLAAFSGLRPSREGGARVERADISIDGEKRAVVHNYGAGGTGFQAGYGMAVDAVDAAADVLREIQEGTTHLSRL